MTTSVEDALCLVAIAGALAWLVNWGLLDTLQAVFLGLSRALL